MLSPAGRDDQGPDLLAANSACGQALLSLVSNGNACLASLLDASERMPDVFTAPDALNQRLMPDFEYFSRVNAFEANIDADDNLLQQDSILRDTYMPVINKIFDSFQGVYNYVTHLNKFVEDVDEGVYMQQSLETLFMNTDGKQLLCEALYVYGVMLYLIDMRLPGLVRERILVAYYRYSSKRSAIQSEIDDICTLLRSTGFDANAPITRRPINYPESYFNRVKLNETYVSMVIGRLRNDELYNQLKAFPLPEHKSTAFGGQAAMLYVCLFFCPQILHSQTATMREIVDKFWPDSWITSIYLGMTVNLIDAWEPYKAARQALSNTLEDVNITAMASRHGSDLKKQLVGLSHVLNEGVLTREYVVQSVNKLLNSLRKANVTLRWMLLHYSASSTNVNTESRKCQVVRHVVQTASGIQAVDIFDLMLQTAEFEYKLKQQLKEIVQSRGQSCSKMRDEVVERLQELADVFSGVKPLTRVSKNEKLQRWFLGVKAQMEQLDFEPASLDATARTLVQVGSLHSLDTHVGVRQFLNDLHAYITLLLRTLNIRDSVQWQVQTIGDFAYAWNVVDLFTSRMQQGIQKQPELAIRLRSAFMKLASGLDLALLRIQQSNNEPVLASVSQFYSHQLVLYLRKVLQVIPSSVFSMLSQIVELQANRIDELPARLERDKFREVVKLDDRFLMAKLTHAISLQTEGLLSIKSTLVGIIRVQPRQVLEDGIRAELVKHASSTLHNVLTFNAPASTKQLSVQEVACEDLCARLKMVSSQMDAFRRSFAYISDYMHMAGLHIWQHEINRIIAYNVEQECNTYRKIQITDDDSMYQSRVVPIQLMPVDPSDPRARTWVGRLINRLMLVSHIRSASCHAHVEKSRQLFNGRTVELILSALGAPGVQGLTKLTGFMLASSVTRVHTLLTSSTSTQQALHSVQSVLSSSNPFQQPQKVYDSMLAKFGKGILQTYVDEVGRIGQLIMVRDQLVNTLHGQSQCQARLLHSALNTLNQSLLLDINSCSEQRALPEITETLVYELGAYLDAFGFTDVKHKKYFLPTGNVKTYAADLLFLLTVYVSTKYVVVKTGLQRIKDSKDTIVPYVLCTGIAITLRHYEAVHQFNTYMATYVLSYLQHTYNTLQSNPKAEKQLPMRFMVMVELLKNVAEVADVSTTELTKLIPGTLLTGFAV